MRWLPIRSPRPTAPVRSNHPSGASTTTTSRSSRRGGTSWSRIVVPRNPLAAIFGESGKGGCLVSLLTGEVELDLDGHEIDIRHDKAAISLSQGSNRELFPLRHLDPRGADGRHVTIRNGTVDLSDDDRGNDGIGLINKWTQPGRMRGALGTHIRSSLQPPEGVVYARTEYHLEKLKVLSRGVSVAVEGEWNVIRDCVIESSGNAAIFSAGPNVLIENCEIRLRGLVEGQDHYGTPLRAAIVLREGSNAIIRNNRIRVDAGGLPSDTHCILVRDGATGVVIENNTFIGVDGELVTAMEGAEVDSRGNTSTRRASSR